MTAVSCQDKILTQFMTCAVNEASLSKAEGCLLRSVRVLDQQVRNCKHNVNSSVAVAASLLLDCRMARASC